jgi:Sugar phosphate isomerases/epimerases
MLKKLRGQFKILVIIFKVLYNNNMKLGISTATFFGKELTEDAFYIIRKMGIDVCEVFMTTFSEYEPEFGNLLAERAKGIEVYSIHSLNLHYEPELNNPAVRTRSDAEKIYRKVLENGKKLGAKSYTYHGGARLKNKVYTFDYKKLGNRLEELYAIAQEYGIELSYENVHWAFFSVPEFWQNLRLYSPNLKCTLDIKQAMQAKLDYTKFIPVMQGRLNNVHLSDYDANGALCVPGRGIVDYYKLFSMLRDFGYDGNMMLELYAQNYKNYSEITESIEYLQNILAKIH